jgi:hypothetical protein
MKSIVPNKPLNPIVSLAGHSGLALLFAVKKTTGVRYDIIIT